MRRLLVLLALLLIGCVLTWWQQNFGASSTSATPPCTPLIASTGEHLFPIEFQTAPPAVVYPGQLIHIEFSGAMILLPSIQQCGDERVVHQPNQATAENLSSPREIQITLNGDVIHRQRCGYRCTVEFTAPITPGLYEMKIEPWGLETYQLTVEPFDLT